MLSRHVCALINVEIRPRWDWNARHTFTARTFCSELKSDQDGIEIHTTGISVGEEARWVEIRPRWDWNRYSALLLFCQLLIRWNQTKMGLKFGFLYTSRIVMLKSDQDGIEMREQRVAVSEMQRMVEIRQRKDYLNEICERALVFFSEKRLDICGE